MQQVMRLERLRNGRLRGLNADTRWEGGYAEYDLVGLL